MQTARTTIVWVVSAVELTASTNQPVPAAFGP
jgi:hypothetical protein